MHVGAHLLVGLVGVMMMASPAQSEVDNGEVVHQRMSDAGFIPLAEMEFGGRDVRRVLPIDPYGFLPIPGVELERHANGSLTLRVQYRGWTGQAYEVSQAEWDRLLALEQLAFAPPGKNSFKHQPGVVVHCWSGLIEAHLNRATSWWACNDGTKAAQAYTNAVLLLAMEKRACPKSEKETLWQFSDCFADHGRLDDSALQGTLAILQARWTKQREPGSDILANARQSLRAARENPTVPRVSDAHRAVLAFGRQQRALGEILQGSFSAFPESDRLTARNAAIIEQLRLGWRRDIEAQNGNYIQLLEELAELLAKEAKTTEQLNRPRRRA